METSASGSTLRTYVKIYPWKRRQITVARPTIDWLLSRMTLALDHLVNKPFMITLIATGEDYHVFREVSNRFQIDADHL